MDCARKHGRYGHRDATMIVVAYRHGLRASEVCDLQWQQIELSEGRLHVLSGNRGVAYAAPASRHRGLGARWRSRSSRAE
jgi:type 1 fimbriae regulatory protein FimE